MYRFILKKAVPVPKLTDFDNYLFVGPHPDDIEVACGGTVARLSQMGKKITFLIVTDGCVGSVDPSLSAEQIISARREESLKSAQLLGVEDVRFLSYTDGGDYSAYDVARDIARVIIDVRPNVVLCPDHTVTSECHPDHLKAGRAATDAVFYATWDKLTARMGLVGSVKGVSIAYYYTAKPNGYVGVTRTSKLHIQAVSCHKSQFTADDLKSLKKYFSLRERRFGLRCGKIRAEGFRILSPTHQHCFPEAGE